MDDDNIFGGYYETKELKNKRCFYCGEDFKYKVHGNRLRFKKRDMSYYVYLGQKCCFHSHDSCFEGVIEDCFNSGKILMNGHEINDVALYNRFSKRMFKKNYLKDSKRILNAIYLAKFVNEVRFLFKEKINFSFHSCTHVFKEEDIDKFEKVRIEFNKKYKSKGIKINKTPKDISLLF